MFKRKKTNSIILSIFVFFFIVTSQFTSTLQVQATSGFDYFITRSGDKLMDGGSEFRFVGWNIGEAAVGEGAGWIAPDPFEVEDLYKMMTRMGSNVGRYYVISVGDSGLPYKRHVTAPNTFDETTFRCLDKALQLAEQYGIRIIIPLVNRAMWWGAYGNYAAFRGKTAMDFWSDAQLKDDFKATLNYVLNRTNYYTGVKYKDDKTILCWELGNEHFGTSNTYYDCVDTWSGEMAAYIKSIDSNHLVMDGRVSFHEYLEPSALTDPNIDIINNHCYNEDVACVQSWRDQTRGIKPFILGEMGAEGIISPDNTAYLKGILDEVRDDGMSGALMWALYPHSKNGGVYTRKGDTNPLAFTWPGSTASAYDETGTLNMVREHAYQIRGLGVPAITSPDTPVMLPISSVHSIKWRSGAGAETYDIQRSESADGPWTYAGTDVKDDLAPFAAFNDASAVNGESYYYRIIAKNILSDNTEGLSDWSNVVGPVKAANVLTLTDDMVDFGKMYEHSTNFWFDRSDPGYTGADTTRLARSTSTPEYVVYKSETDILSFTVDTDWNKIDPAYSHPAVNDTWDIGDSRRFTCRILGSADGVSYEPLPSREYVTSYTDSDWEKHLYLNTGCMPQGTRYLKITFPNVSQNYWNPEINKVDITYAGTTTRAENVAVNGQPVVGQLLDGSYIFKDDDGDLEGTSLYRWLESDTADGLYTPITGATERTFTLTSAQEGKYIKFEVTPKDANGDSGPAVQSSPTNKVMVIIISNGGFETGDLTSWTVSNTSKFSVTNEVYHSGAYSLKVNGPQTWSNCQQVVEVQPNTDHIFSFFRKGTGKVAYKIAGLTTGTIVDAWTSSSDSDWTKYTASFNSAGNTQLRVYLSDSTDVTYFDDFELRKSTAPRAENVVISGPVKVGYVLNGNYAFIDDDVDTEGTSLYQWLVSDAVDGQYTPIIGATQKTLLLTSVPGGKYIKFEVTPVDSTGRVGTAVQSSPTIAVETILKNPGFETGSLYPWTPTNVVKFSVTNEAYHSGIYSLKVTGPQEWSNCEQVASVQSSKDYIFSFYRKGAGKVAYKIIGLTTGTIVDAWTSSSDSDWTKYTASFNSGGNTQVRVYLSDSTDITYFDDFELRKSTAPIAENVTISGLAEVGQVLSGNYDFIDEDGDTEGVSLYRWLESDTVDGLYTPITGAAGRTFTLTSTQAGKYIKFEVTPVDNTAKAGIPVQSDPTNAVEALLSSSLLSNSGFETGSMTSWKISNSSKFSVSNEEYHSGNYSLKVTGPQTWSGCEQVVDIQPNTDYVFSFYGKGTGKVAYKIIGVTTGTIVNAWTTNSGSEWKEYTASFNSAGNTKLRVYLSDAASAVYIDDFKLEMLTPADTIPPVTTAEITGEPGSCGWYITDVSVELIPKDEYSEVASTEYSLSVIQSVDGTDQQSTDGFVPYTSPLAFGEGVYTLAYRSTDAAGNVETAKEINIMVDKTAPISALQANGTVLTDNAEFEDTEPIVFTSAVEDNLSGVESVNLTVDGTPYSDGTPLDFRGMLGTHTVGIAVTDIAGNKAETVLTFVIKTSIASINKLLDCYMESGDLKEPLAPQLYNRLKQAEHQLDMGDKDKAQKHMEDFIKHLNNKAMDEYISADAKKVLDADAKYLTDLWSIC